MRRRIANSQGVCARWRMPSSMHRRRLRAAGRQRRTGHWRARTGRCQLVVMAQTKRVRYFPDKCGTWRLKIVAGECRRERYGILSETRPGSDFQSNLSSVVRAFHRTSHECVQFIAEGRILGLGAGDFVERCKSQAFQCDGRCLAGADRKRRRGSKLRARRAKQCRSELHG
jgi:hypothetical protein